VYRSLQLSGTTGVTRILDERQARTLRYSLSSHPFEPASIHCLLTHLNQNQFIVFSPI
jgi:hypothetical protein